VIPPKLEKVIDALSVAMCNAARPPIVASRIQHLFKKLIVQPYNNPKTAQRAAVVLRSYQNRHGREEAFLGPVRVRVVLHREIPKSWPAWKHEAAADDLIVPTSRPDCDNVQKLIYDALNGYAWMDDAQVFSVHVESRYHDAALCVGMSIQLEGFPKIEKKSQLESAPVHSFDGGAFFGTGAEEEQAKGA